MSTENFEPMKHNRSQLIKDINDNDDLTYLAADGSFMYYTRENRRKIMDDLWKKYISCLEESNHYTLIQEAMLRRNTMILDLLEKKIPVHTIARRFRLSRDAVYKIKKKQNGPKNNEVK